MELTLHLVGGDVASSSTESVELLTVATSKQRHFVLKKVGARKGGIMEVRCLIPNMENNFFCPWPRRHIRYTSNFYAIFIYKLCLTFTLTVDHP